MEEGSVKSVRGKLQLTWFLIVPINMTYLVIFLLKGVTQHTSETNRRRGDDGIHCTP